MDPTSYVAEVFPYSRADYQTAAQAGHFNEAIISKMKAVEKLRVAMSSEEAEHLGLGRTIFERHDRFVGSIRAASETIIKGNTATPNLPHIETETLFEAALAKAQQFGEDVARED